MLDLHQNRESHCIKKVFVLFQSPLYDILYESERIKFLCNYFTYTRGRDVSLIFLNVYFLPFFSLYISLRAKVQLGFMIPG